MVQWKAKRKATRWYFNINRGKSSHRKWHDQSFAGDGKGSDGI